MEKADTIALSLTDLVFEHRNKSYGAYELRTIHKKYLQKATVIGVTAFGLILAVLWNAFAYSSSDIIEETGPVVLTNVPEPPAVEPPPTLPPPPAPKPIASAAWMEMQVVTEEEATPQEDLTKNEDLVDKIISTVNVDGDAPDGDNLDLGVGTKTSVEELFEKTDNEIFVTAEQMPQFPGGQEALIKFLSSNLHFPNSAQQKGISGVVYVSFVISSKGEVTDIQLAKGIDADCDKEALRVIGKMPNWKPGKQNGRNVSVRYSLPLRFAITQQN